jgi:hypothetical protein
VVYGGHGKGPLTRIEPADRVTKRKLLPANRLGYVVYDSADGVELAVALGREPNFWVVSARQRDAHGAMRTVKVTAKTPAVRRAVELANAYAAEEHERSAIDEGLK